MIEKIKRKSKPINKQDITKPKSIDDLIRKYDLENADIYSYLDYLVGTLNESETKQIGTNGVTITLTKRGTMVGMNIWQNVELSMNDSENVLIGTLPEDYRPPINYAMPIIIKNSSWQILTGSLLIRSNGNVEITQTTGATITTKQVLGCCTYYI